MPKFKKRYESQNINQENLGVKLGMNGIAWNPSDLVNFILILKLTKQMKIFKWLQGVVGEAGKKLTETLFTLKVLCFQFLHISSTF